MLKEVMDFYQCVPDSTPTCFGKWLPSYYDPGHTRRVIIPMRPYTEYCFLLIKIYLQDVNTYTSVPDSIKLFLVNQLTCRTLAVRGVTVLPRQVIGGTAVKSSHN
jgi:hypothetical protein